MNVGRLAVLVLLGAALTGCVNYTNSKGQKCTLLLDPLMNAVALVEAPFTGDMATHQCTGEPNEKAEPETD